MESFAHTEQTDERLITRLTELTWQEKNIGYSQERRDQLGHEAACIVFELMNRELCTQNDVEHYGTPETV